MIRNRCALAVFGVLSFLAGARAGDGKVVPRPDLFETLVNPSCSHLVDEVKRRPGELKPDEQVLAWIRGYSEGGGIPYRFFFSKYPVISDTYGVFVWDPDAGFARGFEPSLEFTFHGYRNGVIAMKHQDGTIYSALSGVAFDGPRKGHRLKPVPAIRTTWGYWYRAYPNAVTYQLHDKYRPGEFPKDRTREPSVSSRGRFGTELPAEERVLGLELGGKARAYRLSDLARSGGVARDRLDDREVTVLWFAPTRTAAAYAPRTEAEPPGTEGRPVTLEYDGSDPIAPFRDRETSSFWGIEGRARSGPLAGKTLEWLPAVECRWFAWSSEFPETTVFKTES